VLARTLELLDADIVQRAVEVGVMITKWGAGRAVGLSGLMCRLLVRPSIGIALGRLGIGCSGHGR
jgi:hypothetical protein